MSKVEKEDLIILLVADKKYVPLMLTIMNSIKQNVTVPYCFHLVLINNIPPLLMNKIKSLNVKYQIQKKTKQFKNKERKKAYCANIRGSVIFNLLKQYSNNILYMDVDLIVRKNLDELVKIIESGDLVVHKYSKDENRGIKSTVIGVHNTPRSRKFFNVYYKQINKNGLYTWYSDQKALVTLCPKQKNMKIIHLPYKFIDWTYDNNSVVWNGKGFRKLNDKIYLREVNKYKIL